MFIVYTHTLFSDPPTLQTNTKKCVSTKEFGSQTKVPCRKTCMDYCAAQEKKNSQCSSTHGNPSTPSMPKSVWLPQLWIKIVIANLSLLKQRWYCMFSRKLSLAVGWMVDINESHTNMFNLDPSPKYFVFLNVHAQNIFETTGFHLAKMGVTAIYLGLKTRSTDATKWSSIRQKLPYIFRYGSTTPPPTPGTSIERAFFSFFLHIKSMAALMFVC